MMTRRRIQLLGALLVVALSAIRISAAADNQIFIDVPGRFSGFARVVSTGGYMAQLADVIPGTSKVTMTTDVLRIARPLGDKESPVNRTWFEWREAVTQDGQEAMGNVRVDIYGIVPGNKDPVMIRSLWLRDAWPELYSVVQVDDPATPPVGGKATLTVFEEVLTLRYRRVHLTDSF